MGPEHLHNRCKLSGLIIGFPFPYPFLRTELANAFVWVRNCRIVSHIQRQLNALIYHHQQPRQVEESGQGVAQVATTYVLQNQRHCGSCARLA